MAQFTNALVDATGGCHWWMTLVDATGGLMIWPSVGYQLSSGLCSLTQMVRMLLSAEIIRKSIPLTNFVEIEDQRYPCSNKDQLSVRLIQVVLIPSYPPSAGWKAGHYCIMFIVLCGGVCA
jgi:hypothetical protein